jgi:hypothetical protein
VKWWIIIYIIYNNNNKYIYKLITVIKFAVHYIFMSSVYKMDSDCNF